jgi:uncharacterized protein YciI
MKEYLCVIRPTRIEMLVESTPEEDEILDQHFAYLKDYTGKGTVLLAGRTLNTDDTALGIIIFRAESDEAARHFVDEDPAVKRGVMRAALYPYRVALLSDTYPHET